MNERVLLHVCCAPCATHCIRVLRESHDVTLFFSNSNIDPPDEYLKRLAEARNLASRTGLALIEDAYDHALWLERVRGMEHEPERGARCLACFAFSLERTARSAREHGLALFTTTLSVSPHKDSAAIFRVGQALGPFLAADFKKQDGFRRSVELSRQMGLYRQGYCGCEFSRARP
jgi:predicted adenine nucleotide alpha hydrolase (AANH) superfamily ATPase